ncbi:MAG: DUF3791 domain-containing protein [Sphaerochaetaceae bacterium]|nr:DUF3791 domain-containing protein [Sphaerochaetaceae bacterium]
MEQLYSLNDKIEYTVFFISEFAKYHKLTKKEAFNYLNSYNAISFINRNYGIAHTLSFEEMIDNVTIFCRHNGGTL